MEQTLRPLSLGELLDRTFSYYRRHFVMFAGIMAVPAMLSLVFQLFQLGTRSRPIGALVSTLLFFAAIALSLITSALSQGATVVAVSQIQLDRATNVREAFGSIRGQLGEIIVIILNVGVRVFGGMLLLVVPGILAALKYSVTVPAAILEKTGISGSLERSADLTRGDRGRIFIIYLLLLVLYVLASLVWQIPAGFLMAMSAGATRVREMPASAQIVLVFGGFVTQVILGPVMTIAFTLVYYDERVKKEGLDLEHMMQQLDHPGALTSPTA